MSTTLFPPITSDVASRYIATARITPNAVALRIREMLAPGGPKMEERCMWCDRLLSVVSCAPAMNGKVTHGACAPCLKENWGITLQRDTPMSERPIQDGPGLGNSEGARCHAASITDAGSLAGAGRPGDRRGQVYAAAEASVGYSSSQLGTGRACVPLELARTVEHPAAAQACSKSGSMSSDGILPSDGAETGRKTASTEAEHRAERTHLEEDAYLVKQATERSLPACESEQAKLCLDTGASQPAAQVTSERVRAGLVA